VFGARKKCPVCEVLRGNKPDMKAGLCRDCRENKKVRNDWSEFQVLGTISHASHLLRYWFPALLIFGDAFLIWRSGLTFSIVLGMVTPWGLWVFNVFYLYPRQRLTPADLRRKKAALMDKLLVHKIAGEQRMSGTDQSP